MYSSMSWCNRNWRFCWGIPFFDATMVYGADSRFAPTQWEKALFCKDVSHWLGASFESARVNVIMVLTAPETPWSKLGRINDIFIIISLSKVCLAISAIKSRNNQPNCTSHDLIVLPDMTDKGRQIFRLTNPYIDNKITLLISAKLGLVLIVWRRWGRFVRPNDEVDNCKLRSMGLCWPLVTAYHKYIQR